MMRRLAIEIEEELATEIERDMTETMRHENNFERAQMNVATWLGQIVEAHLASRRLRRVETAGGRRPWMTEHREIR
jgi:hypothetical protein